MANRRWRDSASSGKAAEDHALGMLQQAGMQLLERNFRCRQGEIDLVMHDTAMLVFVEVRFRRSALHGSALESVTLSKQRRLLHAAQVYIARNPAWRNRPMRIDVVTLDGVPPKIDWHRNAISDELDYYGNG